MTFFDMISMSAGNLLRRKLRTFLTMLGVLIGTSSIVAMMSIGIGMRDLVMAEYSSYGSITQITVSEGMSDSAATVSDSTKLSESNIKKFENIDHVVSVEPCLLFDMNMQQGKYIGWGQLKGVSAEYISKQKVGKGKPPEASSNSRLEVLAGNTLITNFYDPNNFEDTFYFNAEKLPDVDLLNKVTRMTTYDQYATFRQELKNKNTKNEEGQEGEDNADIYMQDSEVRFRINITGIMEGEADAFSIDSDCLLVDIEQLKNYLTRNFKKGEIPNQPYNAKEKPFNEWVYNQATVNIDDGENVEQVLKDIQDMGFQASSNKEMLDAAQRIFMIIEMVLGAIGMIAFLVAAIGIANTMMMSTYERTKEIGVMKVLGCDLKDIRRLFLTEAGFIGFFGGIMGLLFTIGLSALGNKVAAAYLTSGMGLMEGKISVIPIWLMVLAIVFSTAMGMLAGYFPAKRAMKLSPLAAIRTE